MLHGLYNVLALMASFKLKQLLQFKFTMRTFTPEVDQVRVPHGEVQVMDHLKDQINFGLLAGQNHDFGFHFVRFLQDHQGVMGRIKKCLQVIRDIVELGLANFFYFVGWVEELFKVGVVGFSLLVAIERVKLELMLLLKG